MALDGSYSPAQELERLLHRCPEIKLIQFVDDFLKKDGKFREEELVGVLARLVLHPKYTVPLLGCFRPIAKQIVDSAVALLRVLPNLTSERETFTEVLDIDGFLGEDDYVNDAWNLKGSHLHELACLALCRALDLFPFLLRSVLDYFNFAPTPFERILLSESVLEALLQDPNQFLNVVRTSYRFLILETEVFRTLWDWSCFLDLVQLLTERHPKINFVSREIITDLRWCSMGILSLVLRINFEMPSNLCLESNEAFLSFLRWQDFCMDVSLEKADWHAQFFEEHIERKNSNINGGGFLLRCQLATLSKRSCVVEHNGILLKGEDGSPLLVTSAMMKSLEMISLAISQRWPVLLYGPPGSGKTSIIKKLACSKGSKVLSIHMDEQADGKTLVGSYVCTEQPGEFLWQPGLLTQAVVNGFWVVFEDIDKAPQDIFSILLPLLEGAYEFSTGHGQTLKVNEGFRLLATVTSTNPVTSSFLEGRHSLGAAWLKVMIDAPSSADMFNIVLAWYPEVEHIAGKLIETFEKVNHLMRSLLGLSMSSTFHSRFTLRDLLKLSKRIASLGFHLGKESLSSYARESICNEAMEVFASFTTSEMNRLAIMREISSIWSVPARETLYPLSRPVLQESNSIIQVGRVRLQRAENALNCEKKPFVELCASVHALERIAASVKNNEPVLLVGETGTGKTTLVQTLASRLGQKLTVLNLSQQSDVADLLGGFKPVGGHFICTPLYQEFENLFTSTFSFKDNELFLSKLRKFLTDKNWKRLLSGFQKSFRKVVEIGKFSPGEKRKRPLSNDLLKAWQSFSTKVEKAQAQVNASDGMVFSFVEGAFISALRDGEWILLDEVNLASPEILQRVIGVLDDEKGSLSLAEKGDIDCVSRHPNFRLFACMNPANDAGKRDLGNSLRGRFTEYFVDDTLNDDDLILFVKQFVDDDASSQKIAGNIVRFYKEARKSEERLQDGANQRPHYSLRSLYRALEYAKKARCFGFERSLYDGFSMFFMNLLEESSAKLMNNLICKHFLGTVAPPQSIPFDKYLVNKASARGDEILNSYVLTKSVKEHLRNLAQAIFVSRYPVLLQGPTSSGKTSLVRFLAAITGHEFVRINNHEHTDLQEYLGSYITDASGSLVFQEGALVKAVRKGHWVVLDELNLAPSDVLEALNRLLDDNRELYVPELRETIRSHPEFMLFATQNPPVVYGGRKMLSRAFRNRFIEIHVDDIPQEELTTILEKSCQVPGSRAKKIVDVMNALHLQRQSSKIFAGKHGYITPRDLFRWAKRFVKFGDQDLAYDGYYLMAERLRDDGERTVVKDILEMHLKVKFSDDDLYKQVEGEREDMVIGDNKFIGHFGSIGKIIWTRSLWRAYFLVERCYQMREPVLLVGETGGGKTTVCQLLSSILGSKLHTLNCHQFTETADFLGGFYPVRERSSISADFQNLVNKLAHSNAIIHYPGDAKISPNINKAAITLNVLSMVIKSYKEGSVFHPDVTEQDIAHVEKVHQSLGQLEKRWRTIFVWQDGPLVEAMKRGELFLVDEISLADDSVLERLNSVLEPERKLSLTEKGGPELEIVDAHEKFFILATMNPGGDYGKKELSPALRNRFTEIWVPSVSDIDDLKRIAINRLSNSEHAYLVDIMLNFWEWFNLLQTGRVLTVRDLLSWVSFINVTERNLPAESAFVHGAFLVLLDGLLLGTNISKAEAAELRFKCFKFLLERLKVFKPNVERSWIGELRSYGWPDVGDVPITSKDSMEHSTLFGIHPFYIEKGINCPILEGYEFLAPTTCRNALRVLRALQLKKPVLLEGSPGVGKTSLIIALGKFSGHPVVRINLSEQTDIMDLLGSDLPVESDEGIQFAWSDGILLQALKKGSWVLLDELNLAPQSVLEGLNSILDHRAEIFIPELGQSFKCPPSFRVFACQNPSYEGGGRKCLPKSFLNRFTKVYVDELVDEDYHSICSSQFPSIERSLLSNLIIFNKRLHQETMVYHNFGQDGSPWEFNLRDVIRSCQIIEAAPKLSRSVCFLNPIYLQRLRTAADRQEVLKLYEAIFGAKPFVNLHPRVKLSPHSLSVGSVSIEIYSCTTSTSSDKLTILPGLRHSLQAIVHCVKHQWLCILVGPSSSGKTSIVRLLAGLTGNVLNELNLSSATDISDLLGCFEQYNASRHYHLAVAQVERYMNEYSNMIGSSLDGFSKGRGLVSRWLAFLSNANPSMTLSDNKRMKQSIEQLADIVVCLRDCVFEQELSFSWSENDLDSTLCVIKKLENEFQKNYSVKFEWITGSLVKAIENGEWIVLENANLCNPTVLDRINSLVEQSGSITINECGIVDGNHVVLRPHPKFRMFLTVNPSFGEVSRAMRNRGVEIYMMHPHWLMEEKNLKSSYEIELRETKRFIALSGIPTRKLVEMMAKAHLYAKHEGLQLNVSITNLELSRWVELFHRLIMNGNQSAWSLLKSWEYTYFSSFSEEKGREIVSHAALSFLLKLDLFGSPANKDSLLYPPVVWSAPLKLKDYVIHPAEASMRQTVAYLEYMGPQSEVDLDLTQRKLSFAANWAIEQATEDDYLLYISCLEWFGTRLHSFFSWFSSLLKKELQHSIWRRIFHLRNHLISLDPIGNDFSSMPMLSVEQINICQSVGMIDHHQIFLNCINCVPLLRCSIQQWSKEDDHRDHGQTLPFIPALISLRRMEEKVLDSLVDSASFDALFKLYSVLLEYHIIFWKSIVFSQAERQQIFGNYLIKYAKKLQVLCLDEALLFQAEMQRANVSFTSGKPLLLTHSCHVVLPSSADQYQIHCRLLKLCDTLNPRKYEFLKQEADKLKDGAVDVAMVANVELRILAMQGLGMASSVIGKNNYSEIEIVRQLEDIYQMLVQRLDIEKKKLVMESQADTDSPLPKGSPGCCVFTPISLSRSSGFIRWLSIQPMLDETSLVFDLELLQDLTRISVVETEKQYDVLLKLSGPLRSSLNFSLSHSSRSPIELLPPQNILWTMDAWHLLTGVDREISGCTLQLWLRWHTSLWEGCPLVEESLTQESDYCATLPCKLFRPLKSSIVDNILENVVPVTEYHMHGMTFRAASHNLWQSSAYVKNIGSMLLSVVRCLFQQIIYAHKKSFNYSGYTKIRSAFHSIQEHKSTEYMETLISLLKSSDVFTSLIDCYVEPMVRGLYSVIPTNDMRTVGYALVCLGGLRCNLLVRSTNLDPSLKYSLKYSELAEKIASIELEAEVREECIYLAGNSYESGENNFRGTLLEELNAERKRMQKKIVYRPCSVKFEDLKKLLGDIVEWTNCFKGFKAERVQNFQVVLSNFIDRLSNEYSAFKDITEPVQIALYEIKLGLSLMFSSEIHGPHPGNSKHDTSSFLDFIYEFMRFPRSPAATSAHAGELPVLSAPLNAISVHAPENLFNFAKKAMSTPQCVPNLTALPLPSKFSIYQNILRRIKDGVTVSRFLNDASFKLLSEIFYEIACLWMEHREKNTVTKECGQFKLRARAFKMANIIEIDLSNCTSLLPNDSFSEWQELLCEDLDEKISVDGNAADMDHNWDVKESDLDGIVNIHNQLFGSVDLVQQPGRPQVSEMGMMSSFIESYTSGLRMIKDFKGTLASCFDAMLAPEHLLCLCLEHGKKFFLSDKVGCANNFYKDSNSPIIVRVVEPVTILRWHILGLLKEHESPVLQRILEVIDMILALPLDSPPAKVLSALEFLLGRICASQSEIAKFSVNEYLQPILALMCSWYQLEFNSWPALLDEVDSQIEANVGKLWFPLYSILLRSLADDLDENNSLAIESLQEFFNTSAIGEFKKQLQLLFSFYGQINTDLRRKNHMGTTWKVENAKILYNVSGFYIQLLPKILEHNSENRRTIEKELNQLLKLCRWDYVNKHLTVEAFGKMIGSIRNTRLKLRKIVKKYTDLLQQPLMEYLGREMQRSGAEECAQVQSFFVDLETKTVLEAVADHIALNNKEGSPTWFDNWQKSLINMDGEALKSINATGILSCVLERQQVWHTLDELCTRMIGFSKLWDDKTKNLIKRRQFSELFDFLERCGLSKHRLAMEGEFRKSKRWILQPAYEVQHLLMCTDDSSSHINPGHIQSSSHDFLWKLANKFYFKSISMITHLEGVSLKFHKDISNIQAARSCSYVDDLFEIQQEQRAIIYAFSKKLNSLSQCTWSLSKFLSMGETSGGCFPMKNQLSIFECMWQQKQLIDNLCTLLYEEAWFLQTVEKNHLSSCSTLKGEAVKFRSLIQNVLPIIKESKDTMDKHLLGCNGEDTLGITFLQLYGVNLEMEQLVDKNFELFKTLEQDLSAYLGKEDRQDSIPGILLERIHNLLVQASHCKEVYSSSKQIGLSANDETIARYKADFDSALKDTLSRLATGFESIGHLNHDFTCNIKEWKPIFEKHIEHLQLELIHENVIATVQHLGELLNFCGGGDTSLNSSIHFQLKNMYDMLEKFLAFGENLLLDFLRIHSVVCEVTFALGNIFSSLFVKGFGSPEEDAEDSKEAVNDASGTGMGEGVGATDVSDQISDEDQLLGSSQKPNEDSKSPDDTTGKNDKGIEMEQDFDADAFSVSEDSNADDNEDESDGEQPESAMGAVGDDSNVVDEKVGEHDDDEEERGMTEKYEHGPSVKDGGSQDDELRAKDDSAPTQDSMELNDAKESAEHEDEDYEDGGSHDGDDADDMTMEKDEAFADPSGVNPDQIQKPDENEMNSDEPTVDGESEDLEDAEMEDGEGKANEVTDEADTEKDAEDTEMADAEEAVPENLEGTRDSQVPKEDHDVLSSKDGASQAGVQSTEIHTDATNLDGSDDVKNDIAPTSGKPNASESEVAVAASGSGERLSVGKPVSSQPSSESFAHNLQPNPYRNIGNALEGWKERVTVSVDLQKEDIADGLVDDTADEYGYTAEFQEGTAQALGPATADQIRGDISERETDTDLGNQMQTEAENEVQLEKGNPENLPIRNLPLSHMLDANLQREIVDHEQGSAEHMEIDGENIQDNTEMSDNVVIMRKSFMSEAANQCLEFSSKDDQLGHALRYESSSDVSDAAAHWRRFELLTTRLSHELVEQLRLVLEPTVASKLQGYYKTGKRINMKKVILYIASHYRKDKIWLRRTKPSKRDYQVVIAVDDSRSMSEWGCGNFALQALVTVCRAMSQLEVGRLAVASFGQQGNIKLLHDFDQSFTPEAGIKMISSFTFKQENTIANEPMSDLMKYLDNMLDAAVMRARLPSGENPLQQLVLIIADGRFSEKEKLKRRVRDILSKQCMVAFLILDSPKPNESILDFQEATIQGGKHKISKYLDTFPFPYYVVLKNIEALPRVLADLLRQWFELMQHSK